MKHTSHQKDYKVKLNIFEGPMDLLLHLIKKAKIDIYDIPIALITDQYLDYIRIMQNLNLDVAGDFLIMASYLIYLKSRCLLNADLKGEEDEESPEEFKRKLAQRLIEYQSIKKGAEILSSYEEERNKVVPSYGIPISKADDKLEADLLDLLKAYYNVIKDNSLDISKHKVKIDPLIIQEEMIRILSMVRVNKKMFFRLMLLNSERTHIIINFLAILELVKTQKIKVSQGYNFADIMIQEYIYE